MKISKKLTAGYSITLLYMALVVLGVKHYTMLPQVSFFFEDASFPEYIATTKELLLALHPHGLRAALMLPIYMLSDLLHIDLNIIFGISVIICTYISCKIVAYISSAAFPNYLLIFSMFFGLLFFMNGRIAFAILGNTIILYALFRRFFLLRLSFIKFLFLIWLGVYFCSVSTGTFFVAICCIVVFFMLNFLIALPQINKKTFFSFCVFIMILLFGVRAILMVYFYKNLEFYNGSMFNMLSHGLGKYIPAYFFILLSFVPVSFVFAFHYLKKHPIIIVPSSLVISSILIGVFGFSSLVSGISGFILLLILYVKKNNPKQSYP